MNSLFESVDACFESDVIVESDSKLGSIFVAEVGYNGVVGTCRGAGSTPEEAKANVIKFFKQVYPSVLEDLLTKEDYQDVSEDKAIEDWYGINVFDLSSGATCESGETLKG